MGKSVKPSGPDVSAFIFDLFGVVIAFDNDLMYRRLAQHCTDPGDTRRPMWPPPATSASGHTGSGIPPGWSQNWRGPTSGSPNNPRHEPNIMKSSLLGSVRLIPVGVCQAATT